MMINVLFLFLEVLMLIVYIFLCRLLILCLFDFYFLILYFDLFDNLLSLVCFFEEVDSQNCHFQLLYLKFLCYHLIENMYFENYLLLLYLYLNIPFFIFLFFYFMLFLFVFIGFIFDKK